MIWNMARTEDMKFGGSSSRDLYIIYDDHTDKDISHNEGLLTAWPLLLVNRQVHHEVSSFAIERSFTPTQSSSAISIPNSLNSLKL
jgi:hypothetical protein